MHATALRCSQRDCTQQRAGLNLGGMGAGDGLRIATAIEQRNKLGVVRIDAHDPARRCDGRKQRALDRAVARDQGLWPAAQEQLERHCATRGKNLDIFDA